MFILFISFQPRRVETSLNRLSVFLIFSYHSSNNLMLFVKDIPGSSCSFSGLAMELTVSARHPNNFSGEMEFRIQYMRLVCTHYLPVPVIGQSLGIVHVCVHPFVCESSLHSSGSGITKFWIVPNACECLSQHIQTLTPTPGNRFINLLPLPCLGFDTLQGGTPTFRYPLCSTQPLTAHTGLPTSMLRCPLPLAWPMTFYTNLPPPCAFPLLWA